MNLLLVSLGGAAGSALRYLVGTAVTAWTGGGFPWATLAVNVTGSLAMGICFQLLAAREASAMQLLLMTGFLGGFTTFSAFSLEAVQLWTRGAAMQSLAYGAASVTVSIAALVLGLWLARMLS